MNQHSPRSDARLPRVAQHATNHALGDTTPDADLIEFDIVFSAECEPIVHHNYLLDEKAWAHDTPAEDSGCEHLRDLLTRLGPDPLPMLIDIKTAFVDTTQAYDNTIAAVLDHDMADHVTLVNWDHAAGTAAHRRHPEIAIGHASRWLHHDVSDLIRSTGCTYLYVDWEYLSPQLITTARDHGAEVGTLEGWHSLFHQRALAWDLPIILANDPATCRTKLLEAQHSS
jgi:hypothetical protein